MHKIALTGGIACGKSQLAVYLREEGVETLDADDIVHELVPAAERRRLAPIIFADPAARKALEARLHPLVRARFGEFFARREATRAASEPPLLRVAIIPLLFECHWHVDYDTILCVASPVEMQIRRMAETRGMTRAEAEARLNAQLPVSEKVARSHYTIVNDSSLEHLRSEACRCVAWLKARVRGK